MLAGAAVEGPHPGGLEGTGQRHGRLSVGGDGPRQFNGHGAVYDNVQSYTTNEPAIDLTAASPLAMAWLASSGN